MHCSKITSIDTDRNKVYIHTYMTLYKKREKKIDREREREGRREGGERADSPHNFFI